jgi:hypothetical protein
MPVRPLTPKQQRFVKEYLVDLNGAAAYRRAGYTVSSDTVARVEACRLLANPNVATAIQAAQRARAERTEVTQDWVIQRLREEADDHGKGSSPAARVAALKLLGQHLGMFPLRHKVGGDEDSPPIRHQVNPAAVIEAGKRLEQQMRDRPGAAAGSPAEAPGSASANGHLSG